MLGVCLGHQAIAQAYGAQVVRARQVMHGKTSAIQHTGQGVFRTLNNPLTVTRYHSLIVQRGSLPDAFEVTAWTMRDGEPDEIMDSAINPGAGRRAVPSRKHSQRAGTSAAAQFP